MKIFAVVAVLSILCAGCASGDALSSENVSFPEIEKWWR